MSGADAAVHASLSREAAAASVDDVDVDVDVAPTPARARTDAMTSRTAAHKMACVSQGRVRVLSIVQHHAV